MHCCPGAGVGRRQAGWWPGLQGPLDSAGAIGLCSSWRGAGLRAWWASTAHDLLPLLVLRCRFESLTGQQLFQLFAVSIITGLLWWQRGREGDISAGRDMQGLLFFELLFPSFRCARARVWVGGCVLACARAQVCVHSSGSGAGWGWGCSRVLDVVLTRQCGCACCVYLDGWVRAWVCLDGWVGVGGRRLQVWVWVYWLARVRVSGV